MIVRWYVVAGLVVSFLLALRASGFDHYVIRLGMHSAAAVDQWWSR